jgi:hypothetical protein
LVTTAKGAVERKWRGAYDPNMAGGVPPSAAERARKYLDGLHRQNSLVTYADEAEAVYANRAAARAAGQMNARLSRQLGQGGLYPGCELVVCSDGEVVGPTVEMLKERGYAVVQRGTRFFVDPRLIRSKRPSRRR